MLPISVCNVDYRLILDTGSAVTIISSNVYNKIPLEQRPSLKKVPSTVKLEVANDELLSVLGEMPLGFKIQKYIFKWDVFVAPIREVWKGPFVVVRKISDISYQIKGHPKTKSKIVHHDRIRRFKCNSIPQWVLPLQQDVNSGNTLICR